MTVFRMARTVTTTWLFNLALADFAVLLSLPISIYSVASGQWPLGELLCKLYMAFLALNFFASIYLLVLISADRCISVLYPVWAHNHRTVQRASWLAGGVWLLATAACSPYLRFRTTGKWNGCEHCYFDFNLENEVGQAWNPMVLKRQAAVTIVHFLLGFLAPLAIIGTCTHLIRAKLWREGWVRASRPKRLLLVLVSTFFIFWFPFNVTLLVRLGLLALKIPQDTQDPKMMLILWATFSFGCLNSCLNPFLYVFVGRDFQDKFFHSLSSALTRAFGEEGFISHPVPEVRPPGDSGNPQVEVGRLPL